MTTKEVRGKDAAREASVVRVDMKLEAIVIPVADVDRAKKFYANLGWRLDADFPFDNGFRIVQFTPPGSGCSIQFGTNITSAAPGSAQGLYLIVPDIEVARDELVTRGVKVSDVFHARRTVPARRHARTRRRARARLRQLRFLRHVQRPGR
jgi:catechol 2,3-dioxygenase-like lactoylglutathione lyase family enzyme